MGMARENTKKKLYGCYLIRFHSLQSFAKNILLDANILAEAAVSRSFLMADLDGFTTGWTKVNKFSRFVTVDGW